MEYFWYEVKIHRFHTETYLVKLNFDVVVVVVVVVVVSFRESPFYIRYNISISRFSLFGFFHTVSPVCVCLLIV